MAFAKPFILIGLQYLFFGLLAFVGSLAVVYITGRMLEFVNSNRGRNTIAIISSYPLSYYIVSLFETQVTIHSVLFWFATTYVWFLSCVFFVLIGWKLFKRFDHFLDSRFAQDDGHTDEDEPERKTKTKSKRKRRK